YDSTLQKSNSETRSYNIGFNFDYSEPVGKKGALQFTYNPNFTNSEADKRTYQFEDLTGKYSSLDTNRSNVFHNEVWSQRGGLRYRLGDRNDMMAVGMDIQNTMLDNDQTFPQSGKMRKSFNNLLPNAMLRLKLSERSNIRLFYRASTNAPAISQLQNVINDNN